jgi:DNA (cytosine-5)-methyltransferase 1
VEYRKTKIVQNGWLKALRRVTWPRLAKSNPLRVADLFSGCGGLTLGAFFAASELGRGLVVDFAVDNWDSAVNVYRRNFGHLSKSIVCDDISKMAKLDIEELDVLLAGPPCQGHSDLNNATRRSDPRNELYMAPVTFALRNRPKVVLIENVPSVVHSKQDVVGRAERALVGAGYACTQLILDVSSLGIPQRRKRHLLVASRIHETIELEGLRHHLGLAKCEPRLIDFLEDLQDLSDDVDPMLTVTRVSQVNRERISYLFDQELYDLPDSLRPPCHRDKSHSYSSMYGRMKPNLPAQTITSGFGSMGQGRFVHPTRQRMLTAREALRIQGFPDYFEFAGIRHISMLRDMIANAVPPAVSTAVISHLFKAKN